MSQMNGWVVLFEDSSVQGGIPKVMGPYPTKELCVIAARSFLPQEREFWESEFRRSFEESEQRRRAEMQKQLDDRVAELGGKAGHVTVGNVTYVVAEGQQAIAVHDPYAWSQPNRRALTGCVYVSDKDAEQ